MIAATRFYSRFFFANAKCVVAENPVMHGYARRNIHIPPTRIQRVQPWQFGNPESKLTVLEIMGDLPDLIPSVTEKPEVVRQSVHLAPPSSTRWKDRSRTFQGVADAMAAQWGGGEYQPDLLTADGS